MGADSGGVSYRQDGAIALITLDRPEKLNAIDVTMGRAYNQALLCADADSSVRAIVITGAGRAFCSGANLSTVEHTGGLTHEQRLPADGLRPELAMLIRKPVVAAVNGPAIGIGLVLPLYADMCFVARDATLGFQFARLGLVAEYGTAWLLPALVGQSRARDLLLSSRRFTGTQAVAYGLAHKALGAADVLDGALRYARELAANCSPAALAAAKQQLNAVAHSALDAALTDSRERMLASLDSPDLAEGFAAASAHRTPDFRPLPAEAD
jgi:enoyl-CoA hydratase/carnithine racemase